MLYDIIIRGGTVFDGCGTPGVKTDLAILGDRIAEIGDLSAESAGTVIDAEGLIVTPGFIDSHAHSDTAFLKDSSGASKLFQGITTEISGQCGDSPFPTLKPDNRDPWLCSSFDEFVHRFDDRYCMAVNQAILTGHCTLRAAVIGYDDRKATEDELQQMKGLLRRDLAAGAWGMSLGLEYAPGFFADVHELSELAKVVREFDGLVPCHMRSEGLQINEAIDELVQVGRNSGAHVHISHLKLDRYQVHGQAEQVWQRVEKAKSDGVHITADMYPFTASCTSLSIRCPNWSLQGGDEALLQRLQGPERQQILDAIRWHYFNADRAETCLFNDDAGYWPQIVGMTLRYVAEEYLQTQDYAAAAAQVLTRTHGKANCIFFVMSEADMLYFLSQDTGLGSDGWALSADPAKVKSKPHPRSYATIPEFFRLAKKHNICSLQEAVRRVTSKPADLIGLKDRGRLQAGMIADIAVFDPEEYRPCSTYLDPVRTAEGMKYVLISGIPAMMNGIQTDARVGRFLRKTR